MVSSGAGEAGGRGGRGGLEATEVGSRGVVVRSLELNLFYF